MSQVNERIQALCTQKDYEMVQFCAGRHEQPAVRFAVPVATAGAAGEIEEFLRRALIDLGMEDREVGV